MSDPTADQLIAFLESEFPAQATQLQNRYRRFIQTQQRARSDQLVRRIIVQFFDGDVQEFRNYIQDLLFT